jgi:SpoVK/Ycf46/Vps4 family AAA+-type ATPase
MAWNYRKRIKVAPGVTLNVSRKGVSTTFGVRGASITSGRNGTYLNTGIPGTGIYNRRKIGGGQTITPTSNISNAKSVNSSSYAGCLIALGIVIIIGLCIYNIVLGLFAIAIFCFILAIAQSNSSKSKTVEQSIQTQIETAKNALHQATNPIQKQILQNFISCAELSRQADEIEAIIEAIQKKMVKKQTENLQNKLVYYQNELSKLNEELEKVQLDVDKDLTEKERQQFSDLCEKFEKLILSEKIWIIISSQKNRELKSSAANLIDRKEINFDTGYFNYIKSSFDIPILRDNQAVYYIYPRYLIKSISVTNFDIIPIDTISVSFHYQKFIEEASVPKDSNIIDYTYHYINKNGGPDKRYAYNPQIPVVHYGQIEIQPLDLTFQFSDAETAEHFSKSFNVFNKNSGNVSAKSSNDNYFNNVCDAVEKLMAFYKKLINDKTFQSIWDEHIKVSLNINGQETEDFATKIKTLFLIDITRCYLGLGHSIDLKSKEGTGLILLMARTNMESVSIDTFNTIKNTLIGSMENYLNQIKSMIDNNLLPQLEDVFVISFALGKYDVLLQKQYLVLLYRFMSITAKADGKLTEQEEKWLSELLKMSENNNGNNVKITKKSSVENSPSELNALIGLQSVKKEITTLTNFLKIQQQRQAKGLKPSQLSYHCVFTGNPGTGKTTVARIVAEIYKELGILQKGHLVETDRSGLVAEYVGQTAVKTNKIIDSALDGVLFIDEAYSLVAGGDNDYGKEAIATLLKRMEDDRDRLVVILAGYTAEMKEFIDSNPGLQSRFNRYIEFPDYSADELYQIFEKNAKEFDYKISKDAEIPLKNYLANKVTNKDKNFGNARFVRNLFEKTIERQANRLAGETNLTTEKLAEITEEDIII